jgi:hypothetical protein
VNRRSIGYPRPMPGCPTALALYPLSVRRPPVLPPASSPPRITATQLPLAIGSAPCGPNRICTSKFSIVRGTHGIGSNPNHRPARLGFLRGVVTLPLIIFNHWSAVVRLTTSLSANEGGQSGSPYFDEPRRRFPNNWKIILSNAGDFSSHRRTVRQFASGGAIPTNVRSGPNGADRIELVPFAVD